MLLVNLLHTKLMYKTNNLTLLMIHAIQDVNHCAGYKRESHETWDMGAGASNQFPSNPNQQIPARNPSMGSGELLKFAGALYSLRIQAIL